jgi:hypothetical protein
VLDPELDDELAVDVGDRLVLGRDAVELGVLRGLDAALGRLELAVLFLP